MIKNPIHPGELLNSHDYLFTCSLEKVSDLTGIPLKILNEIATQKRNMTKDVAIKLQKYSKTPSVEIWLSLQNRWNLSQEEKKRRQKDGIGNK